MALQQRQGPFQVAIEPGEVDALINLLSQEVERKGSAFAEELGVGEDELPPELGRNRRRQLVGVEDVLDLPTDVGLPVRGVTGRDGRAPPSVSIGGFGEVELYPERDEPWGQGEVLFARGDRPAQLG